MPQIPSFGLAVLAFAGFALNAGGIEYRNHTEIRNAASEPAASTPANGQSAPASLGVETADTPEGPAVVRTVRLSAAEKAGVLRLDIIRSIDGKPIRTSQELRDFLALRKAGEKVQLLVLRNKHEEKLTATLTARAALSITEPKVFPDETRKELQNFSEVADEIAYHLSARQPDMQHLRRLMADYAARNKQGNTCICYGDAYGSMTVRGSRDGIFVTVHRAAKDENYRIDAAESVNPLPDGIRARFYNLSK